MGRTNQGNHEKLDTDAATKFLVIRKPAQKWDQLWDKLWDTPINKPSNAA